MGEGEGGGGQNSDPLVPLPFVPSPHTGSSTPRGWEIFFGFLLFVRDKFSELYA